jgi:hypothetical protein
MNESHEERPNAAGFVACPFQRFGCGVTAATDRLINDHKMESVGMQ